MKKTVYVSGIYFALLAGVMLIEKNLILPGDEMGFWFLKVFLIVPLLSFCCGMYAALNIESIPVLCAVPFGFLFGEELLNLIIFNLTNIFAMFWFLFLPTAVGIIAGRILRTVIIKDKTK